MVISDDGESFITIIYEKYYDRMLYIAAEILGKQRGEEAVQDVFVKLIDECENNFEKLRDKQGQYFVIMAKNHSIDIFRKEKGADLSYNDEIAADDIMNTVSPTPEDNFIKAEGNEYLDSLISRLNPIMREILEYKFVLDYSNKEISEKLGLSESAVSSRINRAVNKLKKCLRKVRNNKSMTDMEFENRLKAALLRAAERDYSPFPNVPRIIPSAKAKHKMRAILRNPAGYFKKTRRPIYLRLLRTAAMIAIVLSIAFGAAMAVPQVRAAVVEFVRSWFGDHTEYRISESVDSSELRDWKVGYIPEGFALIEENSDDISVSRKYADGASNIFSIRIVVNSAKPHIDNEHSVFRETEINGYPADVYESNTERYPNHIVIYANSENAVFVISSEINIAELTKIAESITR
jgi:RNA polymerase sigma-70 factor (ECF subfamily)